MQITIDLPDALQISEADLRTELAISHCKKWESKNWQQATANRRR